MRGIVMKNKADNLTLSSNATIREVMETIDGNSKGIVLITDDNGQLIATVTDGDIRRAILTGKDLDASIIDLLILKTGSMYPEPVTASDKDNADKLLALMRSHKIKQIPLLNNKQQVVGLATIEDLLPDQDLPMQAVIMAGGFGTRLRPLTEDTPKPMLPVGNRPMMERTIERLREAGIKRVQISTHYLKDKITDHFGDGAAFGVELNYVNEDQPLGTAGALGLMAKPDEPILVMNGDIFTKVDFRALLDFHHHHQADMTVAVRLHDINVPYGVVETDGLRVLRIVEKPTVQNFINAGMYLLNPDIHNYIRHSEHLDMPDLISQLIEEERMVICFPVREYWKDIGEFKDYRQVVRDAKNGMFAEQPGENFPLTDRIAFVIAQKF